MGGRRWSFCTALPKDCSSLEFSEHWELEKEIRGVSLFSPYFLSLVPQSQLTFLTLFWGGCSKWGEELLALIRRLPGRRKMKHPSLDAVSSLPRWRFPVCLPIPSQRSWLTLLRSPSLYSLGMCHAQLTMGPAGMFPGWEEAWGLCGPAGFHSSCTSTLPKAFTLPQPASAEQLVRASYSDMEILGQTRSGPSLQRPLCRPV